MAGYEGATNFIGGRWVASQGGATFESRNPAHWDEVVGCFARSSAADVAAAAEAATAAYPEWRRTPAPARGAILFRMGQLLEQQKERLALLMVREMGKVLVEARGDVQEAIDMAYYIAAFGRLPNGNVVPSERRDIRCFAERVPVGVVGLITPWNFPIAIPSWKMFPALLAGNTIVFKPAEDTPALAVEFVRLLEEAGIPSGVVNLVTGIGPEAGAAVVECAAIGTISFTGSTDVGRQIAARCGALMKRVSCELGGKNAIVVMDDADLDLALNGAIFSAFGTAGQRCTAASRIILQRGVHDRFRDGLVERARNFTMRSGPDPDALIGPVINRTQLERIHGYVEIGRKEGAAVLTGGAVAVGQPFEAGCFYAPTVLDAVTPGMRVAQEEIFGPVTALIEAGDLDDAISIANGTPYGLSLSVYTRDVSRAFRAMAELEAGLVYVNLPTSGAEIQLPFGGVKQTGNGHREAGWNAMDYCTEWKSVYVNYSERSELVRAQIDTVAG